MTDAMETREGVIRVPSSLPRLPKHPEQRERVYQGIINGLKVLMWAQDIRVSVFGAENIPAQGAAVLAMNHTGYYDFIFGEMPPYMRGRRLTRFMAKKEIFEVPVVGWLMRAMRHIPVDRSAGASSVDAAIEHLRQGHLVSIFPEATISRSFELKPFKNGAARIANAAQAPLIPVVSWGSQRVWSKGTRRSLGRSGIEVFIQVGPAIERTGDADADIQTLQATMAGMLDELRTRYTAQLGPFEPGADWIPASMGGGAPTPAEADAIDARKRAEREAAKAAKAAKRGR